MIRLSGARDVADLMRLVPGFQSSTSFESVAPQASYHGGFGGYSNRLQVLVDGRSVYSPYFIGSIEQGLQTVAMEDIERIEVLRGSNSVAYGARAMLGVINIVTRHTLDTQGGQASLTRGENGIKDSQARVGWGSDDASFRLTMDRRADAGLAGSNGHNQVDRANFRADFRTSANDDVQVRVGGLVIASGKGFAGNVDDPLRETSLDSQYAQFDWRRSLGEDADLAFNVSHTQDAYWDTYPYSLVAYKNQVATRLLGVTPAISAELFQFKNNVASLADSVDIIGSGRSVNDSVSLQHTFRHGAGLRVVWGGEFRREHVSSQALYNTDTAFVTDFTRLFANAEWRLAQHLVLNAGAMAEHSSDSGDSLAPRVMLNWHVIQGQTLRAGVSRAFRPPSTFEKYSNIRYQSNGQLIQIGSLSKGSIQPESMLTHELGYLGDFPKFGLNLDVRVFQEHLSGFVLHEHYALPAGSSLLTSRPWDYFNGPNFTIKGVEYQLMWRPWRDGQFIFNQAYTRNDAPVNISTPISLAAPKLASTLTFLQKLPNGLDVSLMLQNSSQVTLQRSGERSQPGMTRADLRVGYPLRFGHNRGEVALVVQNLGQPYAEFKSDFQFQRRAFVTLRLEN
jgi:iron complex outermembrane receptor protein